MSIRITNHDNTRQTSQVIVYKGIIATIFAAAKAHCGSQSRASHLIRINLVIVRPLKTMPCIYTPSLGPTDWRRLLADPGRQWKRGNSALELAVAWEAARNTGRGLPLEVAVAIDTIDSLRSSELLICLPEHQVQLEGGGHPSQNDLWALLRTTTGNASLTVEAKAGEPLDKLVQDWLPEKGQKSGKPQRLAALQSILNIKETDVSLIRYQLLHRAASALIEARRFRAESALLIVQSFNRSADEESWRDFGRFSHLLGASPAEGAMQPTTVRTPIPLYIGWVTSRPAGEELLGAAV
jgi:hypothetical protein